MHRWERTKKEGEKNHENRNFNDLKSNVTEMDRTRYFPYYLHKAMFLPNTRTVLLKMDSECSRVTVNGQLYSRLSVFCDL